ncbi:MAG: hypothetical protein IPK53_10535 [bacterium]|nr:hypothetical protein [bacterium]
MAAAPHAKVRATRLAENQVLLNALEEMTTQNESQFVFLNPAFSASTLAHGR